MRWPALLMRRLRVQDERAYLLPGPLWWAYHWKSANERLEEVNFQTGQSSSPGRGAACESGVLKPAAAVLLIDEIDKADPDLPNALLEVPANLVFASPMAEQRLPARSHRPLVIITTTEYGATLTPSRCCLVHRLELPDEREAPSAGLSMWVRVIIEPKWPGRCSKTSCSRPLLT